MVSEGRWKPNIVVPTIRDEAFFEGFLSSWSEEFSGCHLIVVEDRPEKELASLTDAFAKEYGFTYEIYDWSDIDGDLKEDAWIISRKTDCVRNYGYLNAVRNNPMFIVTLDDDIKPEKPGHIQQFYNNLFDGVAQHKNYFSTMNNKIQPRGNPKFEWSEVVVSHGGWLNIPDFGAEQQISYRGKARTMKEDFYNGMIPTGCIYSMCGMNLAWKPEFTENMYFPLMGEYGGNPIDRCGDIWAGFYSKKAADDQGVVHYTGEPFCIHTRASNPWSNLKKEKDEAIMGEYFKKVLIDGESTNFCKEYFDKLKEAYKIWKRLVSDAIDDWDEAWSETL